MKTVEEQIIPSEIKNVIIKTIDRATNAVGVITILSTLAVFGITTLIWGMNVSTWISIFYFGMSGICEVFHIQRKSDLNKRLANVYDNDLVSKLAFAKRVGDAKVLEQVTYRGLLFNAIGFEKLPVTIGVSRPLCPKCKHSIIMDANVRFPGRIKIRYFCICGFEEFGRLTIDEMRILVGKALNEPQSRTALATHSK